MRQAGTPYDDDDARRIYAIVALSRSIQEACDTVNARLGFSMTPDALQKLFRRREWGAPSARLAKTMPAPADQPYRGAVLVDLADDDMGGPTIRDRPDTDKVPAPPDTDRGVDEPPSEPCRAYIDGPELGRFNVPPSGESRWLFIPDTHVPYASRVAWDVMMAAARRWRPDGIVICGDFADFGTVSFHEKSPHRSSRLAEEVAIVNEYLDEVDALGATTKCFVEGNHETRLNRYIAAKASALVGLAGTTVPELFRLAERGWRHLDFMSTYQIGDAVVTHTIAKYGGLNAHRQARDAFNATAIVGHTHQLSYETRGDFFGGMRAGMSVGCLFDLDSLDYEHKARAARSWAHGFGVGVLDHASQHMHVTPVAIVNGACSLMGEIVRAA